MPDQMKTAPNPIAPMIPPVTSFALSLILNMCVFAVLTIICSGCAMEQPGKIWSYGHFCGNNYPDIAPGGTSQERISYLENIPQKIGDDIDRTCKQHDICYERHGRNHYLCDVALKNQLLGMKFEGKDRLQCDNVRGQALYYFLSYHPSKGPPFSVWTPRLKVSPLVVALLPIAAVNSLINGMPDDSCKSIGPIQSSVNFSTGSIPSPQRMRHRPEIDVYGLTKSQFMDIFYKSMQTFGFTLNQYVESSAVFCSTMDSSEFMATEPGRESPDLCLVFSVMNDKEAVIRVLGTEMSIIVNKNSHFEYQFNLDLTDEGNYRLIQIMLDQTKIAITRG